MQTFPRRGEVFWVSFDPSIGGEIQKTRPAVVLSNDAANRVLNRLVMVPLSSKIDRIYPAEALVDIGGRQSKAMADQIATVSKLRLQQKLGRISSEDLARVEAAVLLHLDIQK